MKTRLPHLAGSRSHGGRSGSVMIAVLVVATVAMLLGLGRLASFERQVKSRSDREARLHRLLASRSAIAWLEACGDIEGLPSNTNSLVFTSGVRANAAVVAPSRFVFPETAAEIDYVRAGASEVDIGGVKFRMTVLGDAKSAKGDVVRADPVVVSLGDCPDALWTDSLYGVRYIALAKEAFMPEKGVGDTIRFALTPRGESVSGTAGESRAKWAIWIEQTPRADGGVLIEAYRRENGGADVRCLDEPVASRAALAKGIQLAGGRLGVIECSPVVEGLAEGLYPAHEIASCRLPANFIEKFVSACRTNGGIQLTLEATLADRAKYAAAGDKCRNTFWGVAVSRTYDYEISIRRLDGEETPLEVATVVAIDPGEGGSARIKVSSYDTHGLYSATGR